MSSSLQWSMHRSTKAEIITVECRISRPFPMQNLISCCKFVNDILRYQTFCFQLWEKFSVVFIVDVPRFRGLDWHLKPPTTVYKSEIGFCLEKNYIFNFQITKFLFLCYRGLRNIIWGIVIYFYSNAGN